MRDACGDVELRIERRARQLRKARCRFAAIGERGEERDVERVREPENISDESIMFVECHGDLLDHRRREQFTRPLERLGVPQIDEDDVSARQQFGIRSEHRMHRRHATAVRLERHQAGAQRRLERADIKDHAGWPPHGELSQHGIGHTERRGDDDEILSQLVVVPIADVEGARPRSRRVTDLDRETLRNEEVCEPSAELARTADHECATTGAGAPRHDARLLLRGERTADQHPHQIFGDLGRDPLGLGLRAGAEDDFALTTVIPGRIAGRPFHARDLAARALPISDQLDELPIDVVEVFAQVIQSRHVSSRRAGKCVFGCLL